MIAGRYSIIIDGELDPLSGYAFDDVALERANGRTMLLTEPVDQAGLNGLLDRLRGVVLCRVERLED